MTQHDGINGSLSRQRPGVIRVTYLPLDKLFPVGLLALGPCSFDLFLPAPADGAAYPSRSMVICRDDAMQNQNGFPGSSKASTPRFNGTGTFTTLIVRRKS